MGRSITVSTEELLKGNERFCLSPLRAFKECYKCQYYATCESRIVTEEGERKLKQNREAKTKIKELRAELNKLRAELK